MNIGPERMKRPQEMCPAKADVQHPLDLEGHHRGQGVRVAHEPNQTRRAPVGQRDRVRRLAAVDRADGERIAALAVDGLPVVAQDDRHEPIARRRAPDLPHAGAGASREDEYE